MNLDNQYKNYLFSGLKILGLKLLGLLLSFDYSLRNLSSLKYLQRRQASRRPKEAKAGEEAVA